VIPAVVCPITSATSAEEKPKSREEIAESLRSWLTELSPGQRAAFADGDQLYALDPRVTEVALEVLDEFETEEAEPVVADC